MTQSLSPERKFFFILNVGQNPSTNSVWTPTKSIEWEGKQFHSPLEIGSSSSLQKVVFKFKMCFSNNRNLDPEHIMTKSQFHKIQHAINIYVYLGDIRKNYIQKGICTSWIEKGRCGLINSSKIICIWNDFIFLPIDCILL